ncbi:hypothetical protein [Kamptonema formosum]|uniref:hypothetical protein n=1 Tax=Kamptonema formosum TaxID=331992 RepID=UPI0002F3F404|nr:hypothetical protein [Kamptonema formosum]
MGKTGKNLIKREFDLCDAFGWLRLREKIAFCWTIAPMKCSQNYICEYYCLVITRGLATSAIA